jgi:hypothetical protein
LRGGLSHVGRHVTVRSAEGIFLYASSKAAMVRASLGNFIMSVVGSPAPVGRSCRIPGRLFKMASFPPQAEKIAPERVGARSWEVGLAGEGELREI